MHRKKHNHQAPPGWPKGRSQGGAVVAAAMGAHAPPANNPYAGVDTRFVVGLWPQRPRPGADYYRRQVLGFEHQQLH